MYRETNEGSISAYSGILLGSEAQAEVLQDVNGKVGNRFSLGKTFYDQNGQRFDPNFDVDCGVGSKCVKGAYAITGVCR